MNLNDPFTVILTATGAASFNDYFHGGRYTGCPDEFLPDLVKVGDALTDSLWHFMQIFGDSIYQGMGEAPFLYCHMEPAK